MFRHITAMYRVTQLNLAIILFWLIASKSRSDQVLRETLLLPLGSTAVQQASTMGDSYVQERKEHDDGVNLMDHEESETQETIDDSGSSTSPALKQQEIERVVLYPPGTKISIRSFQTIKFLCFISQVAILNNKKKSSTFFRSFC